MYTSLLSVVFPDIPSYSLNLPGIPWYNMVFPVVTYNPSNFPVFPCITWYFLVLIQTLWYNPALPGIIVPHCINTMDLSYSGYGVVAGAYVYCHKRKAGNKILNTHSQIA